MNYNIFMLKLQIADMARQNKQKQLEYVESIRKGVKL